MKKIHYSILILFLLLSCISQNKTVNLTNSKTNDYDSVLIYYISPQIETFDPISPSDFLEIGEYNNIIIRGQDTLNRLRQYLRDTVPERSENSIDTRFMIISFGSKQDTVYHDVFSKIAFPDGKVYTDSSFVNLINKIVTERDSIFPSTRIALKDGRYIMK